MAQMNLTPLDDVLDKHFGKLALQNVTLLKVMWTKLYMLTVWEKPLKSSFRAELDPRTTG